ncbi:hypothetical protein GCM10007416_00790 [Kroppenstedtia guangzhouensis]|jgi:hypothetical protein|uniref:Uncharacterized protein n=1 Tax=Kroppenstedtia guangzhouensis TaxID=1274356 RepID=A0ABQ1FX18_9BACL|nr:hypothetical protein [Kroppenstedtia guangzhouensis]GGA32058.1 hypothetical protein GCM10007416_00790 [Kroppenstedtia guangzhouensis]
MTRTHEIQAIPKHSNGPAMIAILDKRTEERVATVGGPIAPGFEPIFKDGENAEISLDFYTRADAQGVEHLGD